MTARLATRELRLEGAIDAVVGVATLIVAIVVDAPTHWLILVVALIGLAGAAYPASWQAKKLAQVEPAPEGLRVVPAVREVPWFLVSAVVTPFLGTILPIFFWFAGVAALFGAVVLFVRAAVVARAERRCGGPIVRATEATFGEQYFVLAH